MSARLLLIPVVAAVLLGHPAHAQKMDGSRFHNLTPDVETPHLTWAGKLAGGQVKALFVVSLSQARSVVEFGQRMDITLDAVTTALRQPTLGITADTDSYAGNLYEGTGDTAKGEELAAKLESPCEVIVVSGPNLAAIPARCKLKILQQVKRGAGLMLCQVRDAEKVFGKILQKERELPDARLEIARLAGGEAAVRALSLRAYRFGEGRIVVMNRSLNTVPFDYASPRWWADHENNQALLMRTLLWAANRTPAVKMACPELEGNPTLAQEPTPIKLSLTGGASGRLELRLRDAFNTVLDSTALTFKGDAPLSHTVPRLPGGRYYLDVMALTGDGVVNFGYFDFTVAPPVTVELLNPDDVIEGFGPIRATLKLGQPQPGGKAVISLMDSPHQRVWLRRMIELGDAAEIPIEIEDYFMPTLAAFLRVEVTQGGQAIGSADTTFYFPIYNRELPTFSDFLWEYNPGGIDRLRAMAEYDALGHCGAVTRIDGGRPSVQHYMLLNLRLYADHVIAPVSLEKPAGEDGTFRFNAWNRHALEEAEKAFVESKKTYSLGDRDSARLDVLDVKGSVRNKHLDRYPVAFYGIAHESSADYNGGFSELDNQAFAAMLAGEYGDIATLNAAWGRDYKRFETVPHLKMQDAQARKLYPEWLAHRRFVNKTVTTRARNVASAFKSFDPHARIGMNSSWKFNDGYNVEDILADPNIGFMSLYSRPLDSEMLRSLRPDLAMVTTWGWVMPAGAYPEAPWYNLLAGTGQHMAWFISGATAGGCEISADYRPFQSRIPGEMDRLRTGLAQMLITTPLVFDGLAIWENYACSVANLLGDPRFIQASDSALPLVSHCYQNGINFDFVAERDMSETLGRYKVLFLCGATSISKSQKQAMLAYVKQGGVIVADLNPGAMNDSFGDVPGGMLPELFGALPKELPEPVPGAVQVEMTLNGRAVTLATEAPMTPGLPICAVRDFGEGKAILLNFSFAMARLNAGQENFDRFLASLLAACGIEPTVRTVGLPADSLLRVREGRDHVLAGLMNRSLAKAGHDGDEPITLTFPETGYIYEPGCGFVGRKQTVPFTFAPPFKLLACFPSKQHAPVIKLSARTTVPGKPVALDVSSFPEGRVHRLQLLDPEGHPVWNRNEAMLHEVFEVSSAEKKRWIHFAYTMPKGAYTLTLTDIVTGLKSKSVIKLK